MSSPPLSPFRGMDDYDWSSSLPFLSILIVLVPRYVCSVPLRASSLLPHLSVSPASALEPLYLTGIILHVFYYLFFNSMAI